MLPPRWCLRSVSVHATPVPVVVTSLRLAAVMLQALAEHVGMRQLKRGGGDLTAAAMGLVMAPQPHYGAGIGGTSTDNPADEFVSRVAAAAAPISLPSPSKYPTPYTPLPSPFRNGATGDASSRQRRGSASSPLSGGASSPGLHNSHAHHRHAVDSEPVAFPPLTATPPRAGSGDGGPVGLVAAVPRPADGVPLRPDGVQPSPPPASASSPSPDRCV